MSGSAKATIDHDVIRTWAEERGGKPACVKRTAKGDDVGILRIDFPGYSGEDTLEHISWDEWFEKFDEKGLALLFQDKTADGKKSRFSKLVDRNTVTEDTEIVGETGEADEDEGAGSKKSSKKKTGGKSSKVKDGAAAETTTDHEVIQKWVEDRGGKPARVKGTGDDDAGILRIDFPGYSGEDTLEHISWDEWFETFDESGLAFLHQDMTSDGEVSRFNKLVSRDRPSKAA